MSFSIYTYLTGCYAFGSEQCPRKGEMESDTKINNECNFLWPYTRSVIMPQPNIVLPHCNIIPQKF